MEFKEAIQIIKQVCSSFKGSLQEHEIIQSAIKCVEEVKNDNRKASNK